jgi:hypothetical protein
MRTLEAAITWNTEENGCIEAPFSGIQPSMLVGGDLIMARVERWNGDKTMERGQTYEVTIKLPYGEHYAEHLVPGMDIRLQVGERVIATGAVTRVLPPS